MNHRIKVLGASEKSQEVSLYLDAHRASSETPDQYDTAPRLSLPDVAWRYRVEKVRGPYGDGAALYKNVYRIKQLFIDERGRCENIAVVDCVSGKAFLLDEQFYADWAIIKNT